VADARKVFVVHGRNGEARDAIFAFLRALGLLPIEWSQAVAMTGVGAPYIGQVLDTAFEAAQAILVLLTPDEIAYLRPEYAPPGDQETEPAAQGRPNVLFEAGMALGRNPDRTILVELGQVRPFSDVAGRHVIRLDNSPERRRDLAARLRSANCEVDDSGSDWLKVGDLTPPEPPGVGLPLARRLPKQAPQRVRLDLRFHDRGKATGRLEIINKGSEAIYDVDLQFPPEAQSFHVISQELPLKRLPAGKSVMLPASRLMGPGSSTFDVRVRGHLEDGTAVNEEVFLSLIG
jgi:hypothetical protein